MPGTTHLFWRQIDVLPDGIHNHEPNQSTAVPVVQRFVSFVDRQIGTPLNLTLNGVKVADLVVVDETGFVYADVVFPHSHGQDTIALEIQETNGVLVEQSVFATSNLDFTFEIRSDFGGEVEVDALQVGQNISITGVEQSALTNKFGIYTGLERRNEQTIEQYRAQTACLWRSFQHASMEKGLVDSLRCLLGDVAIELELTRDVVGNLIFTHPQYEPASGDVFAAGGGWYPDLRRSLDDPSTNYDEVDTPHYYVADIPTDFYTTAYPSGGPLSILLTGGADNTPDGWDATHVQSMAIRTLQAIGNEVFVNIQEPDAIRMIVSEQVFRRTGSTTDFLGNEDVASSVTVVAATTPSTFLPVQGADFTVDVLTGEVTWLATAQQPVDGTIYTVNYSYRLDEAIKVIVRQVKPAQRSIVILFKNQTSTLPKAIEV
jgi:hypothetical protein